MAIWYIDCTCPLNSTYRAFVICLGLSTSLTKKNPTTIKVLDQRQAMVFFTKIQHLSCLTTVASVSFSITTIKSSVRPQRNLAQLEITLRLSSSSGDVPE